ncbi:XkdQ/YqbQ family protein [Candidatus Pyrohabitans sp.]
MVTLTVTLDGTPTTRLVKVMTIDSITKGAKSFEVVLSNHDDSLNNTYEVYDSAKVEIDGTTVFNGWIEHIEPRDDGLLILKGRDKLGQLMDRQDVVESYTNQTRSYIVKDIIQKYSTGITTNNVQSTTETITRTFKGVTAFDVIQEMADEEGFEFYLDENDDLHFEPRAFEDSGLTIELGVSKVVEFNFPAVGYDIVNRVDVRGKIDETTGTQVGARVEDLESQKFYGIVKAISIVDEKLQTADECRERGRKILDEKAWKLQQGEIVVVGYETLKAGQLVYLKGFGKVPDGYYLVIEKRHEYPPGLTYIKISQFEKVPEHVIVNLLKRMREREKESIDESSVLTKFINFYETISASDSVSIQQWLHDATHAFVWGDDTPDVGEGVGGATGTDRTFHWNFGQWE